MLKVATVTRNAAGANSSPPEVQAGLDGFRLDAPAGEVRTQAAAGVEGGVVVHAAGDLAVGPELVVADQPGLAGEGKKAALRAGQEAWVGDVHVVAVIRRRVAPGDDLGCVRRGHGHDPHPAIERQARPLVDRKTAAGTAQVRLAQRRSPEWTKYSNAAESVSRPQARAIRAANLPRPVCGAGTGFR